jgi:hypothetical protein
MRWFDVVAPSPSKASISGARSRRIRMHVALTLILIASSGVETAYTSGTVGIARVACCMRAMLHYAPNHNFDANGTWLPGAAGFNLADITDPRQLRDLPPGVKALIWIGLCAGANPKFIAEVRPYMRQKAIFGFYLMDDPDPRIGVAQCKPNSLRAEADWIHAHFAGALTFIVLMNLSASGTPSFQDSYNPINSHVDLYGIDPYPCRSELNGCSDTMIQQYVAAAQAWGIPRERMVPVYQVFGGGRWKDGDRGEFNLPTAAQARAMLAQWGALLPAPVFDYAYSWGAQLGDQALESSPQLQRVFSTHNRVR